LNLPDVNILVYAFRPDCDQHDAARTWLSGALDGASPLVLTSAALVGFLRVVTHPRLFPEPDDVGSALRFLDAIRGSDVALPVEPGPRYPQVFADLCAVTGAGGNAIPDVHIAAVAIEAGAELVSHDRGFARFPGLRWSNPLPVGS